MNQCVLSGNLGADPDVGYNSEGNPWATFSLAFKSNKKKTNWVKVVCFNKLAEVCQTYLHKGARVLVTGSLDQDKWEILWPWGAGELDWPHLPLMTEDGRILIFDNGTHRLYSRVLELDPITETIEWEYVTDPPEVFFSRAKGSAQRLPNGNTLICESDDGRAFEITRDGEVVWEWFNPATKKGYREQVYRMWRLDPDVVEPLLEKHATVPH